MSILFLTIFGFVVVFLFIRTLEFVSIRKTPLYQSASGVVTHKVFVDRTTSLQQQFRETCRDHYIDMNAIRALPNYETRSGYVKVYFFKFNTKVSYPQLEEWCQQSGFAFADLHTLVAVNVDSISFGNEHPNTTMWKTSSGRYYHALFTRTHPRCPLYVRESSEADLDSDRWWFACVRCS
jgi:hypothetical protein